MASGMERTGVLLTSYDTQNVPTTKNYAAPNVYSVEIEKPCSTGEPVKSRNGDLRSVLMAGHWVSWAVMGLGPQVSRVRCWY